METFPIVADKVAGSLLRQRKSCIYEKFRDVVKSKIYRKERKISLLYLKQNIFMGKDAEDDIFPRLIAFLREHAD